MGCAEWRWAGTPKGRKFLLRGNVRFCLWVSESDFFCQDVACNRGPVLLWARGGGRIEELKTRQASSKSFDLTLGSDLSKIQICSSGSLPAPPPAPLLRPFRLRPAHPSKPLDLWTYLHTWYLTQELVLSPTSSPPMCPFLSVTA